MIELDLKPEPNLTSMKHTNIIIAAGQTTSAPIDFAGFGCLRILVPANFTAGNITFFVSPDGIDWFQTTNYDGTVLSIPVSPSQDIFLGQFLIGVSGSLQLKIVGSNAQVNSVVIKAICSPIFGRI